MGLRLKIAAWVAPRRSLILKTDAVRVTSHHPHHDVSPETVGKIIGLCLPREEGEGIARDLRAVATDLAVPS